MIVYENGDVQRVSASELCSILNDWKRQNKAISVENFGPGIRMPPVYIKKYKTGIKGFRNRNTHEYYLDEFWARLFFGFDSEDSKYNFFIHLNQQMSEYLLIYDFPSPTISPKSFTTCPANPKLYAKDCNI